MSISVDFPPTRSVEMRLIIVVLTTFPLLPSNYVDDVFMTRPLTGGEGDVM